MRLSFDNQKLFTVATDGNLYIYDIKDRDTKGPAVKREFPGIETFSQEILVDKSELEDFKNTKDTLQNEISSAQDSHSGVDNKIGGSQQENEIAKLEEELKLSKGQAKSKYDQLFNGKQDIEQNYERQMKQLEETNHEELEARRNEYSQKMLEDAARY